MVTNKTLEGIDRPVQGWINWQQKTLSDCQARLAAADAGRIGQLKLLAAALEALEPHHHLLEATGMVYSDGSPELRWHRAYDAPYDAVAARHGIALCEKAMSAGEFDRLSPTKTSAARLFFWFGGTKARHDLDGSKERSQPA
ncbi:hypothetical protein IP69_13610 [Bosea sp. AAP35]|uniref:hypothetical protein n=1 Tax=Bosea sp. AAP35 TaxID=1523417 RepID=UPI0006B9D34E|nr:hypothetical protein [Bosea sp. AAP35]KPF67375.1 hypothetical protein IP69_13610 [Bosea sp. AAP35]